MLFITMLGFHVPLRQLVIGIFDHEINGVQPGQRGVDRASQHKCLRFSFSVNTFFTVLIVMIFPFMLSFVIFLMFVIVIFFMTAVPTRRLNMEGNTISSANITVGDAYIAPVSGSGETQSVCSGFKI
jgi:hypothetical protein